MTDRRMRATRCSQRQPSGGRLEEAAAGHRAARRPHPPLARSRRGTFSCMILPSQLAGDGAIHVQAHAHPRGRRTDRAARGPPRLTRRGCAQHPEDCAPGPDESLSTYPRVPLACGRRAELARFRIAGTPLIAARRSWAMRHRHRPVHACLRAGRRRWACRGKTASSGGSHWSSSTNTPDAVEELSYARPARVSGGGPA